MDTISAGFSLDQATTEPDCKHGTFKRWEKKKKKKTLHQYLDWKAVSLADILYLKIWRITFTYFRNHE